ncbi:hypothetical protein GE21DRAFT_2180 [Neurospora crassa]|uniref:Uncharacterized protein n=1 Tax=Neurospora crassa (strain ATCC 24698 / 74-OR23-1A / CBS 708.71 / DSM 1257 / FGSC 987) TaxID=367110 RepID=V5IQL1_NEUCR|nr:hypothetical protein NCU16453 [Neurospora crassa OR74A]ESA44322.1 hypothetical protein NCU16453 [Neurospora crassa OR74A]KHE85143.1 hypothetical protein GE21DRAFT_2180 [Neurospora crassa]|eukprot:XP_011393422.1 hypothetical protein NCU16453 [Neurospora crassa OR74A]
MSCRGHSFWLGFHPLGAMLYLYPLFIASLNELRQTIHSSDNDKYICLSSRYDTANNMNHHDNPSRVPPNRNKPRQNLCGRHDVGIWWWSSCSPGWKRPHSILDILYLFAADFTPHVTHGSLFLV